MSDQGSHDPGTLTGRTPDVNDRTGPAKVGQIPMAPQTGQCYFQQNDDVFLKLIA
jgi:hypothetical protein